MFKFLTKYKADNKAEIEGQMASYCPGLESVHPGLNWERWRKTDKRQVKILILLDVFVPVYIVWRSFMVYAYTCVLLD